ncbi:MAG: ABC transporter ATP-binding protein [Agathobacter sp.]
MKILEIKDLTFKYPGAATPTLNHVDLNIEKGDFIAIVGNNGCGKSTLCKVMNGLIPHFITGEFEGTVLADGVDTQTVEIGDLAKIVGYVYQDFENQIVRPTVLDDASYACMNYAMPDYLERGRQALKNCGLEGKDGEYIWQLSGGQTHLLALAGAVSLEPEVLILDEPIAQLDPRHADLIYGILKDLNERLGKTIIVIEHHTEYIADYCKHVVLLKEGHVEWTLPTKEALDKVEILQASNIFPPQVTLAAYHLKEQGKLNRDLVLPSTILDGEKVFRELTFMEPQIQEKKSHGKDVSVSFRNVSISYRTVKGEPKKIYEQLNLDLYKGEKIALIGSNGAGKSTMMKLMTGLVKPNEGEIFIKGLAVHGTKPEQLSKHVSLVYQNPEDMFIKDSIEADIAYAMQVRDVEDWQEKTCALLERFRLTNLKDRDGRLLSGGQMRRASLAIGVALCPEILLLDEPTANLDIATRKEIMKTLKDMEEITDTVMIATHDMQLVSEWAERIIVLYQGHVLADGSRNEIFGNKEVVEKVGIRPPDIFTMGKILHKDAFCYTVDDFLQSFV